MRKEKATLVAGFVCIFLGILLFGFLVSRGFGADQLTQAEVLALKIYNSQLTQDKLRGDLQPLQAEFAKLVQEAKDEKNEKLKAVNIGKMLDLQEKMQPIFEKLNTENTVEMGFRAQRKALLEKELKK